MQTSQNTNLAKSASQILDSSKKSLLASDASTALTSKPPASEAAAPIAFQTELEHYASLKNKVFMTDSEKKDLGELINNVILLREIGGQLRGESSAFVMPALQNVALDLMLNALQAGASEEATVQLKAVVTDPLLENSDLALPYRQNLGGIKGEVLYRWASLDPAKKADLEAWLPGPVSRRIWDNVQSALRSNLAESSTMNRGLESQ